MRVLKIIMRTILILVVGVAALFGWLTFTEYKPAEEEDGIVSGNGTKTLKFLEPINIVTWNTGYGALGDNADFFLDGGTHVRTADTERRKDNLNGMIAALKQLEPDVIFLQEVDTDADRTDHEDEAKYFTDAFSSMQQSFAYNFKVPFIPYPIPPIGKVNSGILTMSAFDASSSVRYQLPCPFKWPIRLGNMKRCLLADRIPIQGSSKELVLINLHLEAYDDGEGKTAQTAMLRKILEEEKEKGNYVIAGGDFNQVFNTVDLSRFSYQEGKWKPGEVDTGSFSKGWQFLMDDTVPSCRSLDQPYLNADRDHFQYYAIDGYIVSENVIVKSFATVQQSFVYTNHNPVLLQVELQK